MYTLGLNAYHGDAAAAIYKGTELIVASEEERFRRVKHWAGLPIEAIWFCLREAGIDLQEVEVVAVSRDPYAKLSEKIWYALKSGMIWRRIRDRAGNAASIGSLKEDLAKAFGVNPAKWKVRIAHVEHHRAHMASAFHVSPFEEAAILSLDGMGDFTSTMRGVGKGTALEVLDSISFPHSLGVFYTTFTQLLGFPHYGDEYKVMGLSPYGTPRYLEQLKDVLIQQPNGLFELNGWYFRYFKEGADLSWKDGAPTVGPLYTDYLLKRFGPVRAKDEPLTDHHRDLATSVQRFTEQVIFSLAENLYQQTGLKNLCVTGGVAQNSVANGKLLQHTSFERLFVPPAGHDAGTSIGSALYDLHITQKKPRAPFRHQAYTGIRFDNDFIERYLQEQKVSYQRLTDEELFEQVSEALRQGAVVGWFQGRAEFGPRALGNRSILVDPSRPDAKDLLNSKIKRRESFRPFAPSILEEYAAEYFENSDSVPFMEKVLLIRPEKRAQIPAVTHVDGTGRLQTVSAIDNPRYHRLIQRFYEKSGVPILLNTSFNENEPIVNTPEHALACFLRTDMDMLVLENCIIRRNNDEFSNDE